MATTSVAERGAEAEANAGEGTRGGPRATTAAACDLTPTEAAQELLVAYKRGDDPDPYLAVLADSDEADLRPLREDRRTALAL